MIYLSPMGRRVAMCLMFVLLPLSHCTKKSPHGFRLPEGNVEQGKRTFVKLGCSNCHEVFATDTPKPVAEPAAVVLGGGVSYVPTDGQLFTSIVNPSHRIAKENFHRVSTSGGVSRMGDYSDVMTVQQMIDLVAFLHKSYRPYKPER